MIKKISLLALVLMLLSCEHFKEYEDEETSVVEQNQSDQVIVEDEKIDQPYQTVENEQQAEALNAEVVEKIESVKEVEVQDRVFFDYNSFAIDEIAKPVLNTQIEWLKNSPEIKITIEGHCDERGTREYNIALGEKRALSVKNYLVEGGVDASRIQIVSYGKERPAYFGSTEDVYAKNRRSVVVPQ